MKYNGLELGNVPKLKVGQRVYTLNQDFEILEKKEIITKIKYDGAVFVREE